MKNKLIPIILIVLIIMTLGLGVYYYKLNTKNNTNDNNKNNKYENEELTPINIKEFQTSTTNFITNFYDYITEESLTNDTIKTNYCFDGTTTVNNFNHNLNNNYNYNLELDNQGNLIKLEFLYKNRGIQIEGENIEIYDIMYTDIIPYTINCDKEKEKSYINSKISNDLRMWYKENNSDKYTVTIIAQTWCSHCNTIKPYIEEIEEEYNIDINWFDVDIMEDIERNTITETYPINYSGTPHTFIINKGMLVNEVAGSMSKEEFIQFFKDNGVISK